jgi:hypothetical protein
MKPSPWVSFMLYVFLLDLLIVVAGNYASLTGSKKIYPRVFFGVFVVAIPVFLLFNITNLVYAKPMFQRVRWDLYQLLLGGCLGISLASIFAWQHVRCHGNESGTSPLEIRGDLGTTFVLAHAVSLFVAIGLIKLVACAIIGYSLNGHPVSLFFVR